MSHVIEINEVGQLEHYRLAWQSLLSSTPCGSFFHTLDWLELYWRHFAEDQKLRVLVVHAEGKPIGILPLCVDTERSRLGVIRKLTYPVPPWATSFGPIGPNPTATLLVAMRHIRETPRDWNLIDLPSIDESDGGRTERALRAQGFSTASEPWASASVVRLDSSWDQYVASRDAAWQEEHRRGQQQLAARGEVRFVRYRPQGFAYDDGDPRWDLYTACEEISQSNTGSNAGNGVVHGTGNGKTTRDETTGRFLRDVHETAVARGMLDLCLLLVAQQPVAYLTSYHDQGRLLTVRTGVVPAWAGSGANHVLWANALEDSFVRGDRRYEIPADVAERCSGFVTDVESSWRLLHYRPLDVRAQAVRLKSWRRRRASEAAGTAVSRGRRLGLLPRHPGLGLTQPVSHG